MAEHHIVPKTTYYTIFALLMLGTAITVAVAYLDLGPLNTVVALTIACTKATLVVLFFMHVKYSPRLIGLVAAAALLWLAVIATVPYAIFAFRPRYFTTG